MQVLSFLAVTMVNIRSRKMKVALYARVSSDKQDIDPSISAQLKALREYTIRNNHDVSSEFVDEAETGRTSSRPAFREMINLARRPNNMRYMLCELWLIYHYRRVMFENQELTESVEMFDQILQTWHFLINLLLFDDWPLLLLSFLFLAMC